MSVVRGTHALCRASCMTIIHCPAKRVMEVGTVVSLNSTIDRSYLAFYQLFLLLSLSTHLDCYSFLRV